MQLTLLFLSLLILNACQTTVSQRHETAHNIAVSSGFKEINLVAFPFLIRGYTRAIPPKSSTLRIYIEGDGLAWLDRATPSADPTPRNPIALRLAGADPNPNVVYLARPCQYNLFLQDGTRCPDRYWTQDRFNPEIVTAMDRAIDDIKARHGAVHLELVGFSGGAGIAVLIAATRHDVISLRAVAGNLDTEVFTRLHHVSPLPAADNPAKRAARLAQVPQLHIIGGRDTIVPDQIFETFFSAAGKPACTRSEMIADMTHDGDWATRWPSLLTIPLPCVTTDSQAQP